MINYTPKFKHHNTFDEGCIATAAFRYALGRQTSMVDTVSRFLIANAGQFSQNDRDLYTREIRNAIEQGEAGMDCDVRDWQAVLDAMDAAGFSEREKLND